MKVKLDRCILDLKLATSINNARSLISQGLVKLNDCIMTFNEIEIAPDSHIQVNHGKVIEITQEQLQKYE